MNAEPPAVPDSFIKKLKQFDRNLGIEWVGDHFCIVDESKIVARYKRDRGGLIVTGDYVTIYDRLFHLPVGRQLDESVVDEMRYRDTYRFGDKRNFESHLNRLANKAGEDQKKEEQDFNEVVAKELPKLRNFSVVVPGRKIDVTA